MKPINKLLQCLYTVVCVEGPGDCVCACGAGYTDRKYGTFAGFLLADGCDCPPANQVGNVIWSSRHTIAGFLRGMSDALEEDRARMLHVLPNPNPTDISPPNDLPEHLQRVWSEKRELDERKRKLDNFVGTDRFSALPDAEQTDMLEQLGSMCAYSRVLRSRLRRHAGKSTGPHA